MGLAAETRALLGLAVPLTLIQLTEGLVRFIDTLMMGWLGTAALAAGGLGAIIFWTVLSFFTGLLEMTGALAAEAYGAGDRPRISAVNTSALSLCLAVSIPTMGVLWNLDGVLPLLGQAPPIVAQTTAYLRGILWGLPAALGLFVFKEVTTALMQPRLLTLLVVVTIPVNVALNYGLMYGRGGLPALGVAGIGLSSAIVFWLNFGIAAACLAKLPDWQPWRLFRYRWRLNLPICQEIVWLGWPLCVDYGTEFSALTTAAFLMGQWSTEALAAHNIVMATTELLLMVAWGLSYAAAMRTAHKIGEKRPDIARRIVTITLVTNCVLMGLAALPLWLFPAAIAGLYVDTSRPENQAVLATATTLFKIGVLFQIFQGFRLISLGILQGLRDTHFLATVDFLAHWGVGIGLGYFAGQWLNLQGVGLWWSLALGQAFAAVLLTARVQQLLQKRLNRLSDRP